MSTKKTGLKFKELISQNKEAIEKEQIELETEGAQNQLNHDLHAAKTKVSAKKKELLAVKRSIPFNTANIVRVQRELALAEKDVADITELSSELF